METQEDESQLSEYRTLLAHYISQKDQKLPTEESEHLRRQLHACGILPEDLLGLHIEALKGAGIFSESAMMRSLNFLMKMMSGYSKAYREHQELKDWQKQLDTELDIASALQKTLLDGKVPACSFADIGAISEPAKRMSGDYYRIVNDGKRLVVTIADIVGKGIPAAMCMSMIKYAMDSLPENSQGAPSYILSLLNRVVERNVDTNMFITMFYGVYDPETGIFSNSSAGHEPGFYYSAREDRFMDLEARGLSLGLAREAEYKEYARRIYSGDMIFLLTDGVTEIRKDHDFVEREQIVALIRRWMHLPAAEIVKQVMRALKKMQDFSLQDDFTFIAIKF